MRSQVISPAVLSAGQRNTAGDVPYSGRSGNFNTDGERRHHVISATSRNAYAPCSLHGSFLDRAGTQICDALAARGPSSSFSSFSPSLCASALCPKCTTLMRICAPGCCGSRYRGGVRNRSVNRKDQVNVSTRLPGAPQMSWATHAPGEYTA